jgi:hypothetical protein
MGQSKGEAVKEDLKYALCFGLVAFLFCAALILTYPHP